MIKFSENELENIGMEFDAFKWNISGILIILLFYIIK